MKTRIVYLCALFCSGLCLGQTGVISTYAGTGTAGISGDGGAATSSALSGPFTSTVDASGNLFFIDLNSSRVRRVDAVTGILTTVAGGGTGGDGGLATAAQLTWPCGLKLDSAGNLYITETCVTAEQGGARQSARAAASGAISRVRRVDATTGIITTIAGGTSGGFAGDGGPATSALLSIPAGLAVDSAGDIFIADSGNGRIRRIDAVSGIITTVAGNGSITFSGDGGPATSAGLSAIAVAVDAAGNLYVADEGNNRIRRIDAISGIITTIAGTGATTYNGDGIAATTANLNEPFDLFVNPSGNLVIAEAGNNRVRLVDLTSGLIWTVAGSGSTSGCCGDGDGLQAPLAVLNFPDGVTTASSGTLFISEERGNRVRSVPSTLVTTAVAISASPSSATAGTSITLTGTVAAQSGSIGSAGGSVTFVDLASGPLGNGALMNGSASITTATLAVGTHQIVAQYTGDSSFAQSISATFPLTITVAQGSTTLVASPNPAGLNAPVTLTATVTPSSATGSVEFFNGTSALGTAGVSGGVATISGFTFPVGSYSLTAQYLGDANDAASTSSPVTLTVKMASSITVSSSVNPSQHGQGVTFSGVVSPSAATGRVEFLDGSTVLGIGNINSGVALISIGNLTTGAHSITAIYSGDSNYVRSTSPVFTQNVQPGSTTTSLYSSPNPAAVNSTVTFSADITPTSATGTVQFLDGSTVIATTTVSSGLATFTTSTLSQGVHSITASYLGDTNNAASVSTALSQSINLTTALNLVSSVNPSTTGQTVTFTASVNPAATGSITFLDGSTTLITIGLSSGVASYPTASLAAGTHQISATYSGDATYLAASSAPLTQTVKNASTVSLSINAPQPLLGQSVTFTANVSPSTATGTVQFLDGSTVLGTSPVASGTATFTTSTLAQGSHAMTAVYTGDATDTSATSNVLNVTVKATINSLTFVSTPNPSFVGQAVTLTATINPAAATGTVQFLDGGAAIGTATLANGSAVFTTSTLAQGTHSISLSYSGDSNYYGANTSANNQVVNAKNTSTVAVSSSQNPALAGSAVTFSATVSPSTATGTVQFLDGSTVIGTATLSNGAASFATSSLAQGTHSITAAYAGDAGDLSSTSGVLSQVMKISTGLTGGASPNPAIAGQSVTLSASVAAAATGTVQFTDGATVLATVNVTSGSAAFSTSSLAAGTHAIGVAYSGDGTYFNASTTFNLTVLTATSTAIGANANPVTVGQSVTFTATVSPAASTGSVSFFDGGTLLGTVNLSGGSAALSTAALGQGSHSITAVYGGDASHAGSSSAALNEIVKANTTVTVASSSNPSVSGQSVTFTATVSPSTATGTMTFFNGSTSLGSAPVSNGVAQLATSSLTVGSHSITASYGGDPFSNASTSAVLTQLVQTATTTTLTSNKNPAKHDQTVTFTATISPSSATGTVKFFDGATLLGSVTLSNGRASLSGRLSDGTHSIQAVYGGDSTHAGSSATLSEVIQN